MCCFSGPVEAVTGTQIFARMAAPGRQVLIYALQLDTRSDVAMILPLPTPARCPDDAVRFVALDGYPDLFADVARAFPVSGGVRGEEEQWLSLPLEVVEVGAFVASFVPGLGDFGRLDARFRLPAGTLDRVPGYADWGFAVFQLKAGAAGLAQVHPMAFEFPTRRADALFFPTVHIHDGTLHAEADFAHTLYGQGVATQRPSHWSSSGLALGRSCDAERARGLIDPGAPVEVRALHGRQPNQDVWAALVKAG